MTRLDNSGDMVIQHRKGEKHLILFFLLLLFCFVFPDDKWAASVSDPLLVIELACT